MRQQLEITTFILLTLAFLVYSMTGVFTKLASNEVCLSVGFFVYLAIVILLLGLYAVLWQIVLKRASLTHAFSLKSMTVLFSLGFAYLIFNENITTNNVIGAGLIILGIILNSFKKTAL